MTDPSIPEPAVQFENVSIKYRVPQERISSVKEYTVRFLQRRIVYSEFWAVKGVSFDVQPGEVFGIVGRNGAGKSTMLKVMARVLQPTSGRVVMRGSTAPLLELGGGFHPELTGRENIYMNMALLGHSRRQTDLYFDQIIDFADIEGFIDTPIRTYSTGMVARLGFAVATSIRPDILLVDEVLSVGDTSFQEKCLARMFAFQEQGTTIIIVSHSMATVEAFCEKALWIDQGQAKFIGPVSEVIDRYLHMDLSQDKPGRSGIKRVTATELMPVIDPAADYVSISEIGGIYPTRDILDVKDGAVTTWVRFREDHPGRLCAIFHTDDSRYVLYVDTQSVPLQNKRVRRIIARAGGNRKVLHKQTGSFTFPEISASIDTISNPKDGDWHLLAMNWQGYPEGKVTFYLDGNLIGEAIYDSRNDDGRPMAEYLAVGMRPSSWTGDYKRSDDGYMVESRPETTMSIAEGGVEIQDMRLYKKALSADEIQTILTAGQGNHPG
jgi:ABC-type polysaccharide/polyol phosphate transport system ATPase subunit